MPTAAFGQLVAGLLDGMGQSMNAVRPTDDGLLLRTTDGFLFAFLEDPTTVSLASVQRLVGLAGDDAKRLAVLTPGHLPLALTEAVVRAGGSVVDSARFAELARGLGLGAYLGEEPRPAPAERRPRLLPSAQQLDATILRAKTWLDWGVPVLALRFYRQAATSKPEFVPARVGIGRSLLALGLVDDAARTFAEILAAHPDDVDARLGQASVLGAKGKVAEEIRVYRTLLAEGSERLDVRTHLLAAEIAEGAWADARREVEAILAIAPEDPQFRFLHAATLWKTREEAAGNRERDRARTLGLEWERERSLAEHLGLPPPIRPAGGEPARRPSRPAVPSRRPARRNPAASRRAPPRGRKRK